MLFALTMTIITSKTIYQQQKSWFHYAAHYMLISHSDEGENKQAGDKLRIFVMHTNGKSWEDVWQKQFVLICNRWLQILLENMT